MAFSFEVPVVAVRVTFSEEKGWHGGTDRPEGAEDHLPYTDQVTILRAGKTAEEFFDCPAHEYAWCDDLGKIAVLLNANGVPEHEHWALINEARERARPILETYRDKALKVIDRLVECGRVEGSEFVRFPRGWPAPALSPRHEGSGIRAAGYSVPFARKRASGSSRCSGSFFRRSTHVGRQCRASRVRFTVPGVARLSSLGPGRKVAQRCPGCLFPVETCTGTLIAHLRCRRARDRKLPTTCGVSDQADPLRCHLRSVGFAEPGVLSRLKMWQARPRSESRGFVCLMLRGHFGPFNFA